MVVPNWPMLGLGVAFAAALPARAAHESVLYYFPGHTTSAPLLPRPLLYARGALYGTTFQGGSADCGCGTVFKVTLAGVGTRLYSFSGQGPAQSPNAALIDAGGTLYGTTLLSPTAFKVTPDDKVKLLYDFGQGALQIYASLLDVRGTLYGTAASVGGGGGEVFSITKEGAFSTVVSLGGNGGADQPESDLISVEGALWGTTTLGGTAACECGTVFTTHSVNEYAVLYSFQGGADGATPQAGLTYLHGRFFGTTSAGGGSGCGGNGCGTVFRLTKTAVETILHRFGSGTDGAVPVGNLIDVGDVLYGATSTGGLYGYGTVYKVTENGTESVIYSFPGGLHGATPTGVMAVGGTLYGTASGGKGCLPQGCGVVFRITP